MSDKRFRELHAKRRIRDPFSYWYSTHLLFFRKVCGMQYRPGSKEEAKAFWEWLNKHS